MSIHVAVGLVSVKHFDHKGLHQFHQSQGQFRVFISLVTDEDPCGRNILLKLRECSLTLHKSARQRSMSLYHIMNVVY